MSEQHGGPVGLEAVELPCTNSTPQDDPLHRRLEATFQLLTREMQNMDYKPSSLSSSSRSISTNTPQGITQLIASSFLNIEPLGTFVLDGQYSLLHNNTVTLPQIWESMVKEDWEVEMRMHDIAELEGFGGWVEETEAEKNGGCRLGRER